MSGDGGGLTFLSVRPGSYKIYFFQQKVCAKGPWSRMKCGCCGSIKHKMRTCSQNPNSRKYMQAQYAKEAAKQRVAATPKVEPNNQPSMPQSSLCHQDRRSKGEDWSNQGDGKQMMMKISFQLL